ncbi:hypothetical protein [Pseudomonas monteilii]|uniref:hypothetical protein n=1 Tax=Pseudomonas monteilii TaxID=76759 RepID=UPI001E4688EA|nr:hypothetical protein [Pseudomonas monteilii]MCE1008783.1 hypothetical protein [Pseudomonas monteilii]MDH0025383.1 hypothetical protein [Pseudomonas monteilii]WJO32430.1 hypothetical protein LU690_25770 [Pseudomonas monteilii]WJR46352.1 hypothetical protein LU654_006990 [Pseudomonas monteilii]
MFSVAVGWLGWSPQVAWATPLPELFLAMDARVEWARMTHPFATGGKVEDKEGKPKPSEVADKLRRALTGNR